MIDFYFETIHNWIDEVTDINHTVIVTNWEEILNLQLKGIQYPVAVLEIPDIMIKDQGGLFYEMEGAITILKQAESDAVIKTLLNDTFLIAQLVIQEMFCNNEIHPSFLQPVIKATADDCYGWRFIFTLKKE